MTLKTLNKKFAFASLTILTAAALAGAASGVNAVSSTANISSGEVKIYAQQAAPALVGGVQDNQTGTVNDGSAQNVTGGIMANVQFTATQVTPPASGAFTETNNTPVAGTTVTKTTDATGVADFTGLTTGYWLFKQVTTVAGITSVSDFIVQVNTADNSASLVNVYPKLNMTSANGITGDLTTNATNPIDGSATPVQNGGASSNWSPNNETTSVTEGNTVNFILTPTFDPSMTNDTGTPNATPQYVITETLTEVAGLNTLTNNDVSIAGLTQGTDYNVTISGGTVTISLTPQGITDAAALTTDGDSTAPGKQLQVTVTGTVANNYVGSIVSNYTTAVTNAYGADLSNTDSSTTTETVNVGGVDIKKVDALTNTPLAGATFVLVAAPDAATAATYAAAGTHLADPSSGTTGLTSDSTGMLEFQGVNLVDSSTGTGAETSTHYWAVEVAAPAGYPLPIGAASAFDVTAQLSPAAGDNTIQNSKGFNLPFTGGAGIAAVLIIAAGAGAGAIVIRRRKKDESEEVSK